MLQSDQFDVNEAWVVFKLNDQPIHTDQDGDFNVFALIDAASCFILSSSPVLATSVEPSKLDSRRLLKQGKAHKKKRPKKLFVPSGQPAELLAAEAKRLGISVVYIPEDQLFAIIGEARKGFRERFG
ncbi:MULTISPECIES: hypothetical protein [Halomonas]|uniref:Uncharacterized protein n=1 Tax=Halomonas ventosae TaxID=229007 RepID=A0A4V6PRM8_9GAMM|nr:hypothetical protein [Halomonas ventosae]TDN95928.1 hypothetical protein DFO68_1376 [Halomonas ventosae]